MERTRQFIYLALLSLFLGLSIPASAQCGEDDPECVFVPPQSQQIATHAEGGDLYSAPIGPPSSISVLDIEPIAFIEPVALPEREWEPGYIIPNFERIQTRLRIQDPSDVSCGVQALGMALDALDGSAPTSDALLNYLLDHNYMYDFGTGVEELAVAAREFGYAGSVGFHGWSLPQLQSELAAGRPVVVDLGANGPDLPGHFVTLTGISEDWQWVAYSDPTVGERTVPLAEFMRLWNLQGQSGVIVASDPPPASSPDYEPWTAAALAMMATLVLAPSVLQDLRRRGAGGNIHTGTSASPPSSPEGRPHDPPPPKNLVLVQVPHVETVVIGEKVIGGHWDEHKEYIAPRWETVSAGHWEWQERQVAYTAYRPKSILVQKVVNVVREVTEQVTTWVETTVVNPVTTWVQKTISKPVTTWVKRTSSWLERTWLGRWIRKTRTWFEKKVTWVREKVWEPVTRWVTQKVLKPVTSWVKRVIVEPVKKLVEEIVMESYTAYRTEKVEVWTPPVKKYIPGYYETKRRWVEETAPITQQVTRWNDVFVDAGDLPGWVAESFFRKADPSLSTDEQVALFNRFRDTFGRYFASDPANGKELSELAFDIFFNGLSAAENEMAMSYWRMTNAYVLSLRSEPGAGAPILGYIPYGTYLHWTHESEQIGETTWYKVQYLYDGEMTEGWVASAYLTDYVPGSSNVLLDFQMDDIFKEHGIQLQGDWNLRDKRAAALAIADVAAAFSRELGMDGDLAFKKVFENISLVWGTEPESGHLTAECSGIDTGGCTSSAHMINFGSLWAAGPYRPENVAFQASVNNVVHELGHAFANLWWGSEEGPYTELATPENKDLRSNVGFLEGPEGAANLWRQHWEQIPTANEVYADMFLGWVFNSWADNPEGYDKAEYMSEHMSNWVGEVASEQGK